MKITVDRSRCTGLGICESFAEDYFEIEDAGTLAILKDDVSDAAAERVRAAVASCPTEALRLVSEKADG